MTDELEAALRRGGHHQIMAGALGDLHDPRCWCGPQVVAAEDLKLLVRVALGIVKRRRLRGQSRVYDDPVDVIEAVARKYVGAHRT